MFGTDLPMEAKFGQSFIKTTQNVVDVIPCPDQTKGKIRFSNAIALLG